MVDHQAFYYSVLEYGSNLLLRCYGEQKSSFIESDFSWGITGWINVYAPLPAARIIRYGLENGWKPKEHNQVLYYNGDEMAELLQMPPLYSEITGRKK